MADRRLTVALPWHTLGHGNLGVDALTRANIAMVRSAAARIGREVRLVTLCSPVVPAEVPTGVTVGPMPRIRPLLAGRSDFIAALRACDLVLDIGEGDSWADIYGARRFAFHAGTKIAALALGKPLVLAPQTIGPFENAVARAISSRIMNSARAVFTRDGLSSAYLAGRKLRCETAEFIDVAFGLPFASRPRGSGRVRVGLNVSGLLYRSGDRGRNGFGLTLDYPAYTRRLIAELLGRDAEIHLVPHVHAPHSIDDDWAVIPALLEQFPQIRVAGRFSDASAAKSFMSGMDFLVGGRMHACIGAFSSGTPVVPVAYSRKFNGLFDTLGYAHYVDGRAVNTDAALAKTLRAFDARKTLSADIQRGLAIMQDRLEAYEARLAAILSELA